MRIAIIAATERRGKQALFEKGFRIKENEPGFHRGDTVAFVIQWETDLDSREWDGYYVLYGAHRRNRYTEIMKEIQKMGIVKLKEL